MAQRAPKYMDRLVETLVCPFCSGERINAAQGSSATIRRGDRFCANCGSPWPPHQVIRSNGCYASLIRSSIARDVWFDAVRHTKETLLFKAAKEGAIPCGFWIRERADIGRFWDDTHIEVLLYVHGGAALRPLPVGGDPRFIQEQKKSPASRTGPEHPHRTE